MPSQSLIFRFVGVDDGASAQFDRMAGKAEMSSKALKAFGAGAAVAFAVVAVESVKAAAKFQASTELIHTQAGVSQAGVDAMRKSILGLAGSVGTGPEALSEAMFHIASTGQRGAKAVDELRVAAEGAKVGQADLTDVTNALNATIVSGIKGAGGFGHAMGALNAIIGAGDMHMQDLADALGTGVLVQMKTFGVTLTQSGAALAVFGDNNIRGAQAATYLRQAVQAISKPSINADSALGQIGLTVDQLKDRLASGGLTGALTLLHSHFESSGVAANKWGDILEDAFTKKAGTGISILVEQYGRYETKQAEVAEGAKNFGADWTATTKTLSFQFDRLQADVQVLAVKLGDDLIPVTLDVIHGFLDVGDAVQATVGFFREHETAVTGVAAALTAFLIPALVKTGIAMGASAVESFGIALLYARDAVMTLITAEDTAKDSTLALEASFGPLGVAAAVVGAVLAVAWEKNRKANEAAKQSVDDFNQSLHTNTSSTVSLAQGVTDLTSKYAPLIAAHHQLEVSGNHVAAGIVENSGAYKELESTLAQYRAQQQTVTQNERLMATEFGLTRAQVEKLASANGIDLTGSTQSVENAIQGVTSAAALSKSPLKDANSQFATMASNTSTAAQDVTALTNAFDDLLGNFLGVKQAQLDYKNDLVELIGDLKKSHDSISLNTAAGRVSRAQYIATASALNGVALAMEKNHAPTADIKAQIDKMLGSFAKTKAGGKLVTDTLHRIKSEASNMKLFAAGEKAGEGLADGLKAGLSGAAAASALQQAHALGGGAAKYVQAGAQVQSPSTATIYVGKMLAEGLIVGWLGESERLKHMLSDSTQHMLAGIETATNNTISRMKASIKTWHAQDLSVIKADQSALKSTLSTRASDISSLKGTIAGSADLSGLFGTDANGNATTANVGQFLNADVGPLQQFAKDLKWAAAHKLSPVLLSQIANLGAVQGDQVLQQFMSGQASISAANTAENAIQGAAGSAATTATAPAFAKQIASERKQLHDDMHTAHADSVSYHKVLEKLIDQLRKNEKGEALDVAKHITITIHGDKLKLSDLDAKEIIRALNKVGRTTGVKVKK